MLEYLETELRKLGATRTTRSLGERIAAAKRRIAQLKSYTMGELGTDLGTKPTTECVLIEDATARRIVRPILVAEYMPPRPEGAELCHRCDVPACVNHDHWFWGTRMDNVKDRALKGRSRGKVSYEAKLANAEAKLCRLLSYAAEEGRDSG